MTRTIRGRLTLWYAAAFALFLGIFAIAIWIFIDFTTRAAVDDYLAETAAAVAGAIEFERGSGRADEDAIAAVVEEFRLRDIDILVLDRMSGVTLSSRLTLEARVPGTKFSVAPVLRDAVTLLDQSPNVPAARTVSSKPANIRLFTLPYSLGERPLVVGVARSLAAQERTVHEAGIALALGIPVMLAFASLGGYVLARKSLQPVMDMSTRAVVIGASNLHERLPLGNPEDELGRLAALLNDLLGRLERSFEQQRSFMADASHELRTPVAVISAESELALGRDDRTVEELRDALGVVRAEGRRMRGIVEDLFLLARADGGERPLRMQPLYLHDLLEECARSATPLATSKHQIFTISLDEADMAISGDEALLRRLFTNLLDNAVKYTPQGGSIELRAATAGAHYIVDVTDTGAGIPPDERDQIFDRFYRSQAARARKDSDGAGLGLAIARYVARAHGGDLELVASGSQGSHFRVMLPAPVTERLPDGASSSPSLGGTDA